MNLDFLTTASQLGGTVFTVVAFLWYLLRTSDRQIASQIALAKALQKLTDTIEINSSANVRNTDKLDKSTVAVDKNTEVIEKVSNGKNHL